MCYFNNLAISAVPIGNESLSHLKKAKFSVPDSMEKLCDSRNYVSYQLGNGLGLPLITKLSIRTAFGGFCTSIVVLFSTVSLVYFL